MGEQFLLTFVNNINQLIAESTKILELLLADFDKVTKNNNKKNIILSLRKYKEQNNEQEQEDSIREHLKVALEAYGLFSKINQKSNEISINFIKKIVEHNMDFQKVIDSIKLDNENFIAVNSSFLEISYLYDYVLLGMSWVAHFPIKPNYADIYNFLILYNGNCEAASVGDEEEKEEKGEEKENVEEESGEEKGGKEKEEDNEEQTKSINLTTCLDKKQKKEANTY